jgi:hypothetical protein
MSGRVRPAPTEIGAQLLELLLELFHPLLEAS